MKRSAFSPLRSRRLAPTTLPATPVRTRDSFARLKPTASRSLAVAGLVCLFGNATAHRT